ncbi:MAG: hypothetical protein JSW08_02655 [archaeon]|nr:MAG: hypothetical protein JSW08_02655 [archaeon]
MNKKLLLFSVFIVILFLGISLATAATFELNGTVVDTSGNPLNDSNISIITRNETWGQVYQNYTSTNASGWFNISLEENSSHFYAISMTRNNTTIGYVDYVGKSLPALGYVELEMLANTTFYLQPAGTINITAVNGSGNVAFGYMVKDQKLGYEVSSCSGDNESTLCYVPRNRNYSIMIYPSQGSGTNFVPVSYNWNNFTSNSSYNLGVGANNWTNSTYNVTTKTLNRVFNISESTIRLYGYLTNNATGGAEWDNDTNTKNHSVIPFVLEPGNMISIRYGTLPFNASAWNGSTNEFNSTNGWYNITLPFAPAETVSYILYATAYNGSWYGKFRNITLNNSSSDTEMNFSLYSLYGGVANISVSDGNTGSTRNLPTAKQTIHLVNSTTNSTMANVSAHIEVTFDYSSHNCTTFTIMENVNQQNASGGVNFSVMLLNVTGNSVKEINIFSNNFAPRRVGQKTAAQLNTSNNISVSAFNPVPIGGNESEKFASVAITLIKSNSTCDVPNPPSDCIKTNSSSDQFNPMGAVFGGGALSFRMGQLATGIIIHYVNVDLMASGPPDGLFDNSTNETNSSGVFESALRFGSKGPTIYDYVLISIPYSETNNSGLNDSSQVNISIPHFYDDDWTVIWNTTNNGSNGTYLAGNYSHYNTSSSVWETLMGDNICQATTTGTSQINTTYPCHIDTTNNRIWIRIPHFSGTGPSISGSVYVDISTPETPSGGGGGTGDEEEDEEEEEESVADTPPTIGRSPATVILEEGESFNFSFNETNHTITILNITNDTVTFEISSEPITLTLTVGETAYVDLDEDTITDISIKLESITDGKATFSIKSYSEEDSEDGKGKGLTLGKGSLPWIIIILAAVAFLVLMLIGKSQYLKKHGKK